MCSACRSKQQAVYDATWKKKNGERAKALNRQRQREFRIRHGKKVRMPKPPPCKTCEHRDVLFCKHPELPAFLHKDGARFIASHGHCPIVKIPVVL